MRQKYHRYDLDLSLNSSGYIKIYSHNLHEIAKNKDRGHCHFFKSICVMGDPLSMTSTLTKTLTIDALDGESPMSHVKFNK